MLMRKGLSLLAVLTLLLCMLPIAAPAEGIEGTWTCPLADGESTLVIRPDGSATLKVSIALYRCTWKLSGSSLTLTQNNTPLQGTYDGSTISLNLGSTSMRFTRTGDVPEGETVDTAAERAPILFQNIPWGSTQDKARTAVAKAGYVKNKNSFYSAKTNNVVYSKLYSGNAKEPYELSQYYNMVLCEDYVYSDRVLKKIAGYEVDTIAMCYVYSENRGKLDTKNPGLISVNVELKATDEEAAMADLENKLTQVYGPCDQKNYRSMVWLGGDGTCVVLYDFFSPTLLYARTDNMDVINQLYQDLGYGNVDENDLNGL